MKEGNTFLNCIISIHSNSTLQTNPCPSCGAGINLSAETNWPSCVWSSKAGLVRCIMEKVTSCPKASVSSWAKSCSFSPFSFADANYEKVIYHI